MHVSSLTRLATLTALYVYGINVSLIYIIIQILVTCKLNVHTFRTLHMCSAVFCSIYSTYNLMTFLLIIVQSSTIEESLNAGSFFCCGQR